MEIICTLILLIGNSTSMTGDFPDQFQEAVSPATVVYNTVLGRNSQDALDSIDPTDFDGVDCVVIHDGHNDWRDGISVTASRGNARAMAKKARDEGIPSDRIWIAVPTPMEINSCLPGQTDPDRVDYQDDLIDRHRSRPTLGKFVKCDLAIECETNGCWWRKGDGVHPDWETQGKLAERIADCGNP